MNVSKSMSSLNNTELEVQIGSLDELSLADHIIISLSQTDYKHAILSDINKADNQIEIIYYDDSQIACSLKKFENNETENNCEKSGVKKSKISIDLEQVKLFKVDYAADNQKCLTASETLDKANKFVGQTKYNIFTNNDEHFCIYCKTGKAAKLFIVSPNDISLKNIAGVDLKSKIVTNLAQESGSILLVNTAKHIASKFPRSAVSSALPAAAEVAGGAIGAGVEAVSMGYDIYKKNQQLKDGKINEIKFKKYIAKRVTRGVNSVAGGVAGGILGQMVIPVPVLGAFVGGLVGGLVGAAVGQAEGILLGEVVEAIDDKLNEMKAKEEEKQSKYNVLHHLVFKYNSDQLKDGAKPKIEQPDETKSQFYLKMSGDQINEDDYEIYVLNDANETVSGLNVDKRKSVENFSADELPPEMNVFFRYSDLLEKEKNS